MEGGFRDLAKMLYDYETLKKQIPFKYKDYRVTRPHGLLYPRYT
jgi:hypothetical protein